MDREEALESIKGKVENANVVKHMLATEAKMRALAARLGEDEDDGPTMVQARPAMGLPPPGLMDEPAHSIGVPGPRCPQCGDKLVAAGGHLVCASCKYII